MRCYGVRGTFSAVAAHVFPPTAKTFPICRDLVAEKKGFEIGGPTRIFSRGNILPIYQSIASLDNCNFSTETMWEGTIKEGNTFRYDPDRPLGRQYIAEATSLPMISSGIYDFVLSSHSLEHTANPLRAMNEWMRILKSDGALILVLPHKECTFDHRRPTTTVEHMVSDFKANVGEDDRTHMPEILELYDVDRDWGVKDYADFKQRAEQGFANRSLHQHIFDTASTAALVDHIGLQIKSVEAMRPFHIIIGAQKPPAGTRPNNEKFLRKDAEWRKTSPFSVDHV